MKQTFASLEARAATSILGAARSVLPESSRRPEGIREPGDHIANAPGCPEKGSQTDLQQKLMVEAGGYYFGSLRNALLALKKDQKLRRGWSKQKIIAVLARIIGPVTGYPMRAHDVRFRQW
jgi:hypothetical protein